MHLNRTPATPATNRVNPAELRYLRQAVAATTICCTVTAIQSVVTTAHVTHGLDLTQEAAVLLAEVEQLDRQPLMRITK